MANVQPKGLSPNYAHTHTECDSQPKNAVEESALAFLSRIFSSSIEGKGKKEIDRERGGEKNEKKIQFLMHLFDPCERHPMWLGQCTPSFWCDNFTIDVSRCSLSVFSLAANFFIVQISHSNLAATRKFILRHRKRSEELHNILVRQFIGNNSIVYIQHKKRMVNIGSVGW